MLKVDTEKIEVVPPMAPPAELLFWVDGFLEGKEGLTAAEVSLLKNLISKYTKPTYIFHKE